MCVPSSLTPLCSTFVICSCRDLQYQPQRTRRPATSHLHFCECYTKLLASSRRRGHSPNEPSPTAALRQILTVRRGDLIPLSIITAPALHCGTALPVVPSYRPSRRALQRRITRCLARIIRPQHHKSNRPVFIGSPGASLPPGSYRRQSTFHFAVTVAVPSNRVSCPPSSQPSGAAADHVGTFDGHRIARQPLDRLPGAQRTSEDRPVTFRHSRSTSESELRCRTKNLSEVSRSPACVPEHLRPLPVYPGKRYGCRSSRDFCTARMRPGAILAISDEHNEAKEPLRSRRHSV